MGLRDFGIEVYDRYAREVSTNQYKNFSSQYSFCQKSYNHHISPGHLNRFQYNGNSSRLTAGTVGVPYVLFTNHRKWSNGHSLLRGSNGGASTGPTNNGGSIVREQQADFSSFCLNDRTWGTTSGAVCRDQSASNSNLVSKSRLR